MYVLECSSVCVCILILVYVEHLHTCVRNTSERVLVFLEVIIDQLVTQRATLLYYTCTTTTMNTRGMFCMYQSSRFKICQQGLYRHFGYCSISWRRGL